MARSTSTILTTPTAATGSSPSEVITLAQARRIALAAQGFADGRPSGRIDRRHIRTVFQRIGLLQVDSVNVLVRSEELPMFARLGPHPRGLVRSMEADGELFEYWAHEASLLPTADEPLWRWRKAAAASGTDPTMWRGLRNLSQERQALLEQVLGEISARGPVAPSELTQLGTRRDHWGWRWDDTKLAVEHLFWTGQIAARRRIPGFEREYDLSERHFSEHTRAQKTPTREQAQRQLLLRAARSVGIGTGKELIDYFRLHGPTVKPLLAELVEEGQLVRATVPGWSADLYLHPEARRPRKVEARALLSPFDSLIWERTRTEQLFGMRYRIEIYVPGPKRMHGYYVLPFLLDEQLCARVDLKADRANRTLLVQAAWLEVGAEEHRVAAELAAELQLMAGWLELDQVVVVGRGDLAAALTRAISPPSRARSRTP